MINDKIRKQITEAILLLRERYLINKPKDWTYWNISNSYSEDFASAVMRYLQHSNCDMEDIDMVCNDFFQTYKKNQEKPIWNVKYLKEFWKHIVPFKGMTWENLNGLSFRRHTWITDGTYHYDAECPAGVKNIFELPAFYRMITRECFAERNITEICEMYNEGRYVDLTYLLRCNTNGNESANELARTLYFYFTNDVHESSEEGYEPAEDYEKYQEKLKELLVMFNVFIDKNGKAISRNQFWGISKSDLENDNTDETKEVVKELICGLSTSDAEAYIHCYEHPAYRFRQDAFVVKNDKGDLYEIFVRKLD